MVNVTSSELVLDSDHVGVPHVVPMFPDLEMNRIHKMLVHLKELIQLEEEETMEVILEDHLAGELDPMEGPAHMEEVLEEQDHMEVVLEEQDHMVDLDLTGEM